MAATPDMIPTDLTLEIGDDPSPERFMKAATAFFGYVRELSLMVAPEGEIPQWVVRVREGSDLLAVYPAPNAAPQWVQSVYSRADKGVRSLTDGSGIEASGLSEAALKHLSALSDLASGPREKPTFLRLWVRHEPVTVDATIAAVVREDERLGYRDFGTIEGILDTVQDRHGSLQLRINDTALRQTIKCYFNETQLTEAFETFRKRVEVSGVIHYRKDGTPISISAERIEKLPDDSELPSANDVRGILRVTA